MTKHWILLAAVCLLGQAVAAAQTDSTLYDVRFVGNTDWVSVAQEDGSRQLYRPARSRWDHSTVCSYRACKDRYRAADYRRSGMDLYDPFSAGLLSWLVPGLGQVYDGELLRGAGFFFGSICSLSVGAALVSSAHQNETRYDPQYGYYTEVRDAPVNSAMGTVFIMGSVALWIWNICDAVKVAKVKNLFFRDLTTGYSAVDLSVRPAMDIVPTSGRPTAGLSLELHF